MNENCSTNVDLKSEADDKEAITILCLDFVPEKFHLFVMNYILRNLNEMVDANKIKKRNIVFIREAASFFRVNDDIVMDENLRIFRVKLSHYIRMGRRGMHFCLDVQSYNECRGLISGTEDYLLMFKTTSFRDREDMTEIYRREKRMRPDQINDLSFLNKGECYIAEANNRTVQKVRIILPRSDYWKKEYPNFYKGDWERRGGDWKVTNFVKEELDKLFEENKDKYKVELERKSEKRKIKEPEEVTMVENPEVSSVVQVEEVKPQAPIIPVKPKRYPF